MREVKLTKKMLKMTCADLLAHLGAIDESARLAFPQHVYMSFKDCKAYEKVQFSLIKNGNREYTKRAIDNMLGFEFLNYGPNLTLGYSIKPGFILINEEGIELEQR